MTALSTDVDWNELSLEQLWSLQPKSLKRIITRLLKGQMVCWQAANSQSLIEALQTIDDIVALVEVLQIVERENEENLICSNVSNFKSNHNWLGRIKAGFDKR